MSIGSNILFDSVSADSGIVSESISLERKSGLSIQVQITGSNLEGSLYLEASLNNKSGLSDWSVVPGSVKIVKGTHDFIYDMSQVSYAYVRLKYKAVSGSGSITAYFNTKELS
jgi:hypothetical protein